MQIFTGTVTNGKIVVDGEPLPEGCRVAVIARVADEPIFLSSQDEVDLLAAIAEIERGEFVSAEDLLESLKIHA